MKTIVVNKNNAPKYTWGEGCESFILSNAPDLSVKQETMPPKSSEKLHFHNFATQFFYILSGEAKFIVENETLILKKSEGVTISARQKHHIENVSDTELQFLIVSHPSTDNDRVDLA